MDSDLYFLIWFLGGSIGISLFLIVLFAIWMQYKDHEKPRKHWYDAWRKCNGDRGELERKLSILERKQSFREMGNEENEDDK